MVAKVKLALVLFISGIGFGFCHAHGILTMPQPSLVFDLMTFLTMIFLFIWTIRKRREEKSIDTLEHNRDQSAIIIGTRSERSEHVK